MVFLSNEGAPSEQDIYDNACRCSTVQVSGPRTGSMPGPRSYSILSDLLVLQRSHRSLIVSAPFHDGLQCLHSIKIALPSLALNLLAEHRDTFLIRLFRRFGRARTIALCFASS